MSADMVVVMEKCGRSVAVCIAVDAIGVGVGVGALCVDVRVGGGTLWVGVRVGVNSGKSVAVGGDGSAIAVGVVVTM